MSRIKKFCYSLAICLSALLCGTYHVSAITGDNGFIDQGGFDVHWPQSAIPIKLIISRTLSPQAEDAIRRSAAVYNQLVGSTVVIVGQRGDMPSIESSDDVRKLADSGYVFVINYKKMDGALTTFSSYLGSGEMTGAIIHLPPHPDFRIINLMAMHELGHALGLAHDDTPTSIMYPTVGQPDAKLTKLDILRLRQRYVR